MVTLSVPFTAPNSGTAKAFQREVVEGIRVAISNGAFVKD